jgi:uncharacterized protein associated with vWA-MoxR-VMAP ternary system
MTGKFKNNRGRNKQVGGDQNVIEGSISGGVIVQGRGANVAIQQSGGINEEKLSLVFEKMYQAIQSRPDDPNIDKEEIGETIQRIEQEVKKGDQANDSKLKRWMESLNKMAPDIVDVILASLGGPVSGMTAVLKKVAEHARQ